MDRKRIIQKFNEVCYPKKSKRAEEDTHCPLCNQIIKQGKEVRSHPVVGLDEIEKFKNVYVHAECFQDAFDCALDRKLREMLRNLNRSSSDLN